MKKTISKDIDLNQSAIEKCLLEGDLSKLTEDQRSNYYQQVCETTGLNPLTQPFQYIVLNGKLKMYALKGATDQLRRIYDISCEIKQTEKIEDLLLITVKATNNKSGRVDEDMGFAKISNLKGDMLGNAMLKATTKAKRRVTLSMCGLGMLDEEEIASIPDDKGNGKGKKEFKSTPNSGSNLLKKSLDVPIETSSKGSKVEFTVETVSETITPIVVDTTPKPVSADISAIAFQDAENELDEAFAFCTDKAIHDRIIKLLDEAKYDESKEAMDLLFAFASTHPENMSKFQDVAKNNNKKWQDTMSKEAYTQLYTWMGTLNNFFSVKEMEVV
jgi:hypothetical protein